MVNEAPQSDRRGFHSSGSNPAPSIPARIHKGRAVGRRGDKKFIWSLRFMRKSFSERRSRVFLTLLALGIAGSVLSVFLTLYYDISIKMKKELRAYGANLVFFPSDKDKNPYMSEARVDEICRSIDKARIVGYTPYIFTIGAVASERVILAGVRFDEIRKVNPYWNVQGEWPAEGGAHKALAGFEAARKLKLNIGQTITASDTVTSRSVDLVISGIIKTGGAEEYQIFADLAKIQELSGRKGEINIAYASVMGDVKELEGIVKKLDDNDGGVSARVIRRISRSEGLVIDKIKLLLSLVTIVTLFSTLLCVGATMTAMTLGRRKEIGLKKALGAENKDILVEFLTEALVLGVAGGILGYIAGFILVQFIGRSVFDSAVSFRIAVVPLTVAFSTAISVVASFLPITAALAMDSAVVLKGE